VEMEGRAVRSGGGDAPWLNCRSDHCRALLGGRHIVHMSAAHGTCFMAHIHIYLRQQKFVVEVLDRYELLPGC
jgi:hypothetical protein